MNTTKRVRGRHLLSLALASAAFPAMAVISFTETTVPAGIQDSEESFMVGWGDFDGNGYPDVFSNKHQYTPTRLFMNEADGGAPGGRGFTDMNDTRMHDDVLGFDSWDVIFDTHGFASADVDNDGDTDVIEFTGAGWTYPYWENDGTGNFEYEGGDHGFLYNRAWSSNTAGTRMPTGGRGGLFFDYNDTAGSNPPHPDGRLDVMAINRRSFVAYRTPTAIFRQDDPTGEPNFVLDESTGFTPLAAAGVHADVGCESGNMGDFNGDGVLDVICSDASKISRIFDPTTLPFTDLRPIVGEEIYNRWPADLALGDFNGDLTTDIMAPGYAGGGAQSRIAVVDNRTVHGWFTPDTTPYGSGFNFNASGSVTFEFDWWTELDEVYIGAAGSHPPLAANLPIMPSQGLGHGNPHHIKITLTQAEAAGILTPDAGVNRGIYIGYANGMWQVRFSGVSGWEMGMVIQATGSITNAATVGDILFGQPTFGATQLFLQDPATHELVYSPGNVQQINRSCIAAVAADFDNDMDLDVYFACTGELSNLGNLLYENQGDGTFVGSAAAGGAVGQMPFGRSEAVVTADYDLDGCMDMYVTNGHHFRPFSYAGQHQLFRNNCSGGNHWVEIDLEGLGVGFSNVDGIGATVYAITPDGKTQMREQTNGMHKKAQNFKRLHFGLGANQAVDLEVHWPSGIVDYFANVTADQLVHLVEGDGGNGPTFTVNVGDVTVVEGPSGQEATFTVTLSPAPGPGEQVDVNYQTVNGTALSGVDYTARSGVMTFFEGMTELPVTVAILDDGVVEGDETFTLELSSASTNSATATATIQDDDVGSGPACGEPVWDSAVDRAVFIWNDCGTNNWKLRFTGGGSPVLLNFTGSVQSTQAISGFAPFSVESNDVLTNTPSSRIDFGLFVSGPYKDGFDFTLASGASACFDLTGPTDVPVYAGAGRVPVNLQVGIPGFGACAP